jgi:hypothetical protein
VAFKVKESIENFGLKRMRGQLHLYKVIEWKIQFSNPVYVDDILLVSSDVNLLQEKKKFLSSKFNKKVLGEMSLVIRIETHRDRRKRVLELSHRHAKKSF